MYITDYLDFTFSMISLCFFEFSFFNFAIFACLKAILRAAGHFDPPPVWVGLTPWPYDLTLCGLGF